MITAIQKCSDGKLPTLEFRTSFEAIGYLVNVHLKFGGTILEIEPGQITVQSSVFGKIDTATIAGQKEGMEPVVQLACYYAKTDDFWEEVKTTTASKLKAVTAQLPHSEMAPIVFQMMAPLFIGQTKIKAAIFLAFGMKKEEIQIGLDSPLSINDLLAAIELSKEGTCSFEEALAL